MKMKMTLNIEPLLLSMFFVLLNQGVMAADCNTVCTADYTPVCGTDAKTYSNLCNLNVEKCERDSSLSKLFDGECECREVVACTREYDPHCGTDGKTYSNRCTFAVAKLCSTTGLELVERGECGDTARVQSVDCDTACQLDHNPVCGTDGETYPNLCGLNVKKCQSDSSLSKLFDGKCECRQDVACTREYEPHCGTDGKTYGNRCTFAVAKLCSPDLKLDKVGKCGNAAATSQPLVAVLLAAILAVLTITH